MHHASETVIAKDRGPLSRVTLYPSCLVIERSEELCELQELLGGHGLAIISRIPIDRITGVGLVTSLFLPPLMVVRYAGCSQLSGRTLSDALLENVHMLSLFDRRAFHRLHDALRTMIAAPSHHRMGAATETSKPAEGSA
ncbi:MAG: hypothetical protein NXI19_09815 [Alphaproteobacteria bacterium]|nr:hypothetical protein [Alphaproteobacteria bacterium]